MRLFYPNKLYDNEARLHIFPLLKSLLKIDKSSYNEFVLTHDYNKADCIIIPMSWNYYHENNLINNIMRFYDDISKSMKVISFVYGDAGVSVPSQYKGFVFRVSGRRTKLPDNHFGMPVFIEDPILKYYDGNNTIISKSFSEKPIVGFCGYAVGFGPQTLKELFKKMVKNVLSICGLSKKDVDTVMSTTYFRWSILNKISKSLNIKTNFILRGSYRAGVKKDKEFHSSTIEFYNNIKNSYYTLCMRGAGNFSKRLYETLAMGRIPILINTDCMIPLDDIVDWKNNFVWIDYSEIHLAEEKIITFHNRHDSESLNNLFIENRMIWEEKLNLFSFFKTFFEMIR